MAKLSVKLLESLSPNDVGSKLFDGDGLYGRVRMQKIGIVVTFEYRFTLAGKTRSLSCGKWPTESLKDIRKKRAAKQDMVEAGTDPIEQNKSERLRKKLDVAQEIERQQAELARIAVEKATKRTFSDAIAQWKKLELSQRKDGGAEAMRSIQKDVAPILGDVALIDIKRSMLVEILDDVVARGARVMANHLFGDLRQFYNFAVTRDWVESHPLAGLTKEKIGGRQKERDRYLTEDEIIELRLCLPKAKLPRTTELAIWLLLSTCSRVGELSQAKWSNIDLENGEWFIPTQDSKNEKDHVVFLSDYACQKFHELRALTGNAAWCLPSRDGEHHINKKSIAKQVRDRIREIPLNKRTRANGTLLLSGGPWTPHDLRRTGATMMGELGVIGDVIERCLNHKEQNKLKRTYQRHELKNEQKDAWRLLGDRLLLLQTNDRKSNIVLGKFGSIKP